MHGRMPGWVTRADRSAVQINAALRLNGRELPVTIIDVSEHGCKIRCLHILPIGEVVHIEMPDFQPNVASVRWSLPGMAGLRFI
jgi:hypothetical protein